MTAEERATALYATLENIGFGDVAPSVEAILAAFAEVRREALEEALKIADANMYGKTIRADLRTLLAKLKGRTK